MRLPKFIQLLEAVSVDDFLQLAVVVVVDGGSSATQLYQFTVFFSVGMPCAEPLNVRIARMSELCP